MNDERLTPRERIRKSREFAALYRGGNRARGAHFSLIYRFTDLPYSRLAVVVNKKVGNAVERNKVKRWTREVFRRNKDVLARPTDILFLARPGLLDLSRAEFESGLLLALKELKTAKKVS
ncbi:MAG: ribonuclease P protein component [Candidatus Aminicenantes bacterium]|nr:ribonuclease P protein component [Candidatus Aminicenantes bacterium]